MSTSETLLPLLFLLPPCLLSSSSSLFPLAKAGAAPNPSASAPPPSSFADPVRKPRREVSDPPSFSPRHVRSLMHSLSLSRMSSVLANLFIDHRSTCPVISLPLRALTKNRLRPPPGAHDARDRVQSLSMQSTNVGSPRITARLRLPIIL